MSKAGVASAQAPGTAIPTPEGYVHVTLPSHQLTQQRPPRIRTWHTRYLSSQHLSPHHLAHTRVRSFRTTRESHIKRQGQCWRWNQPSCYK
jgi:hypothetical protein